MSLGKTSSSAVAKRRRDASSVVSFNSTKRREQSFVVIVSRLQIYHCVQINAVQFNLNSDT